MKKTTLDKTEKDMLYLLACGLHNVQPHFSKTGQMNLELLYRKARFHSLTAMLCMVLEQTDIFHASDEIMVKKWIQEKEKAIRKSILLDAEREKILDLMEQAGIWHMPLKGSILKKMYPKYGMRQMADVDILYDTSCQDTLMNLMEQQGYEIMRLDQNHHDIFHKQPIYNFEMHHQLFEEKYTPDLYQYYSNIKERLLQNQGKKYAFYFTDEDFYIYNTAHACRHYEESGTGFRTLVDTYVYLTQKGADLDWDYVKQELKKVQIADFEQKNRKLALKLFSDVRYIDEIQLTEEEMEFLVYIAGSGTYGTSQNRISREIKELQSAGKSDIRTAKLQYYRSRLLPGRTWYKRESIFWKYPFLIPFHWLYRICKGVLFSRKRLMNEIKIAWKAEDESGENNTSHDKHGHLRNV